MTIYIVDGRWDMTVATINNCLPEKAAEMGTALIALYGNEEYFWSDNPEYGTEFFAYMEEI